MRGRSSLVESFVCLIPFLCVDRSSLVESFCLVNSVSVCSEKKKREEEKEEER